MASIVDFSPKVYRGNDSDNTNLRHKLVYLLKDIATKKKITIDTNASIKEAMSVMYENRNGCVVLLKNNTPKGIITESDIVNALKNNFSLKDNALKIARKKLITANENRPVDFAFDTLGQYNIRRIILINKEKEYAGVVLQEDLFDYLEDDVYKIDLKISNIINKSQTIHSVNSSDTIKHVLEMMRHMACINPTITTTPQPTAKATRQSL